MKSVEELTKTHTDSEFVKKLQDAFAIRNLILEGLHSEGFAPDEALEGKIALTAEGETALASVKKAHTNKSDLWARFVVFLSFYYDDLLIDVQQTDINAVVNFLSRVIRAGTLRHPWLFDRILYDRAAPLSIDDDSRLDPEVTKALLSDTEQGVFQIGSFVVGPFGVVRSLEQRDLPPTQSFVAAHCEDPSCDEAHNATLTQENTDFDDAVAELDETMAVAGDASDWRGFVEAIWGPRAAYYADYSTLDLPLLLGSSFSQEELKQLLQRLLNSVSSEIRNALQMSGSSLNFKCSNQDLLKKLSKAQTLQAILVANDQRIVAALDEAIDAGDITIPSTEIRRPYFGAPARLWLRRDTHCSDLGFRAVSESPRFALARLKGLILSIYSQSSDQEQLQWLLQDTEGNDIGGKIENFINKESPYLVLEQLVASDVRKLRTALANLHMVYLPLPSGREQRTKLVFRMLWKLGFPKTTFASPLSLFYDRLRKFEEVAATALKNRPIWEENVRSTGVNVFVSLEDVLDSALAFCTWLLLSDHVGEAHVFNLVDARKRMAHQLEGVLQVGGETVRYDDSKRNTLFPLVHGFTALEKRIGALLSEGPEAYRKDQADLPIFVSYTQLQIFSYLHRYFIFDAIPSEIDKLRMVLRDITTRLELSSAIRIRNGIDHQSDSFPTSEEIAKSCEILGRVVQEMELAGLIPVVFSTEKRTQDIYSRIQVDSRCYSGRIVTWTPSPAVTVIPTLPSFGEHQILVPSLHLPGTGEILRFGVEEQSGYSELWKKLTRRRHDIRNLAEPALEPSESTGG